MEVKVEVKMDITPFYANVLHEVLNFLFYFHYYFLLYFPKLLPMYDVEDGTNGIGDHIRSPEGEQAKASHTEDEAAHGDTLIPCGVGEFEVMFVLHLSKEDFSHHTEDIDRRDDDRRTCDDSSHPAHHIDRPCRRLRSKGTNEDCHLCDETGESRQTEVGKTGNDITHGEERHDFHQARQLTYVTGMRTTVNHTNEGKEECRHQTVSICSTAPVHDTLVIMSKAKSTNPQCDTDE